jgi:hypothetical protein
LARLSVLCALLLPAHLARSQTPSTEVKLKAACLFNFARYTEWPASALPKTNSPIVIVVLGEDPFGDVLDKTVEGRFIENHPVIIFRTHSAEEATCGNIVFVSSSENGRLDSIFPALNGRPLLTVGNAPSFLKAGGMVHFLIEQDSVRFNIDRDAAERVGLRIRSRMLDSAKRVIARRAIAKP